MKTIILTGGGTGGHVIPNLSLVPELKNHFENIVYIGSKNSFEERLISNQKDIHFFSINATKLERDKKLKIFLLPFKILKSVKQAKKILKEQKPCVVFSKGGYVSVPVCIAAKQLKIPIVSHESDLSLGLSNKFIYKLCTTFCTTFKKTSLNLKKAVYTGSPIRNSIFLGNPEKVYNKFNLNKQKQTILIQGGSTGSTIINNIIFSAVDDLTKDFNIIHITGKNKTNKNIKSKNYFQIEYSENINDLLSVSDFVISRAGSNAICELLALKKPMLLIPLSKKASRGDQIENANYFKELNISLILEEENLNKTNLLKNINLLQKNKNKFIHNMNNLNFTNGNKKIIEEILKASKY